ncbi:hypothetical protein C8R43DRAFT_1126629 [Mycena crocata]|nr:hypothetical protein C8R43DRAFT_1126629 [Mycena crocata]
MQSIDTTSGPSQIVTIISAYNQHYALVLRPDDVWVAILTQFNFHVNANAEILPANFVAHDGKKQLTLRTAAFDDFGRLAREIVDLIEKNIVDPSLPPAEVDVPEPADAPEFLHPNGGTLLGYLRGHADGLTPDGARFHHIDCDNIPSSYAEVDVRLVSMNNGEDTKCMMTAGVVGTRVSSSEDSQLSGSGKDATVRPVIGWWLFDKV